MSDFAPWDFSRPLDLDFTGIPATIRFRPIFARAILDLARQANRPLPVERFFDDPSRDVSVRDMLTLLPLAAQALYPDVPPREGLRRIGRLNYHAMLGSPVGRVLVGPKPTLRQLLRVLPRIMNASGNHARASIRVDDKQAVLALDDYYSYVDCAIGSVEAGIESFDMRPDVHVRVRSQFAYDVQLRWSPR